MRFLIAMMLLSQQLPAAAEERIFYEQLDYSQPPIGQEAEAYLGDRMMTQQAGEWKQCITPKRTYTVKGGWGVNIIYKGGEPLCKQKLSSKNYIGSYVNAGEKNPISPVRWREKKGAYTLCACFPGACRYCVKDLTEDAVSYDPVFLYRENTLQQAIEYAGKSGDILKFVYSEFSDGFSRQSFTREFQIDLKEGAVTAYKGAVIEILEANNVSIKYKVIRNFQSS